MCYTLCVPCVGVDVDFDVVLYQCNVSCQVYGGPPPGWTAASGPERGSEVYCFRIPRDCYEDGKTLPLFLLHIIVIFTVSELVPVFSSIGRIYELRLMLEFSGATRYVPGPATV